jgi:hypothetical protein
MPPAQEILAGLEAIANGWRTLAIAWHLALAAGLIALRVGWRPGRRLAGVLIASPLASVSVLAWLTGNPFNGTVFALVTATLVVVALRLPRDPIEIGPLWLLLAGIGLTAFGWAYPHFLQTDSWTTYLYAAPLGLVPCPTLCAATGLALVLGGLGSRGWSLVLAASGLLYGLVGWLRLGVTIDAVLLVGAVTLAAAVLRTGRKLAQ